MTLIVWCIDLWVRASGATCHYDKQYGNETKNEYFLHLRYPIPLSLHPIRPAPFLTKAKSSLGFQVIGAINYITEMLNFKCDFRIFHGFIIQYGYKSSFQQLTFQISHTLPPSPPSAIYSMRPSPS